LLVEHVRRAIHVGKFPVDRFLPTVRELGEKFKASPETVRRGLKSLEAEGLLVARARHGFRVARRTDDKAAAGPVAYVTDYAEDMAGAQPVNWALTEALQHAAAARGAAVLGTPCGGQTRTAVLDRLRAGHASGIVLDTLDPALIETIRQAGLPVVMVNSWWEETEFDVVLQDNYRGGFLAAKHLLDAGCRKIAWLGLIGKFCHSRERFAGAVAALAAAGRHLPDLACVDAQGEELRRGTVALLGQPDRPDGILALAAGSATAVRDACMNRGLQLGKDLRMVGWIVEEFYAREHVPLFNGGPVPPAVVWKASSMAERALALLAERRQTQANEPVRVCVSTRLKFSG
jgi:DNA-binding LacI/PurR family transcriptional regulator